MISGLPLLKFMEMRFNNERFNRRKTLPLIMGFAIPIAIGNIFQLFYSLADTRIVGQFLGENALASVGATSSLNNMIIGFLLGMTNGFAIIVARSYGAKDENGIKKQYRQLLCLE